MLQRLSVEEIARRHAHRQSQCTGPSTHSCSYWEAIVNLPDYVPPSGEVAHEAYRESYLHQTKARLEELVLCLEEKYGLYVMLCVTYIGEWVHSQTREMRYNPHARLLMDRRGKGRHTATAGAPGTK